MIRISKELVSGAAAGIALMLACGTGPAGTSAAPGGEGGGGSGTCNICPGAQGPILTADTDVTRLDSGFVACNPNAAEAIQLLEGPFVVTDVVADALGGAELNVATGGASCDGALNTLAVVGRPSSFDTDTYSNRPNVHGARLFVKAGEKLCVFLSCGVGNSYKLRWSGFRPYDG